MNTVANPYVPKVEGQHPAAASLDALVQIFRARRPLVLTGAGCSTESGVPDYRGPASPRRKREPMRYLTFVGRPEARRRYWARSFTGWATFASAVPNAAHRALAMLEAGGFISGVITQNVDALHQRAGSREVIELHGSLHRVRCLQCGALEPRDQLQERLSQANPGWVAENAGALRPDGDTELADDVLDDFEVVDCLHCGGILKPHVVFFGENVPPQRTAEAWRWVQQATALVVIGSSLTVYSGLRFVKGAHTQGIPVAIANVGPTRGDEYANLRLDGLASTVLETVRQRLLPVVGGRDPLNHSR